MTAARQRGCGQGTVQTVTNNFRGFLFFFFFFFFFPSGVFFRRPPFFALQLDLSSNAPLNTSITLNLDINPSLRHPHKPDVYIKHCPDDFMWHGSIPPATMWKFHFQMLTLCPAEIIKDLGSFSWAGRSDVKMISVRC